MEPIVRPLRLGLLLTPVVRTTSIGCAKRKHPVYMQTSVR